MILKENVLMIFFGQQPNNMHGNANVQVGFWPTVVFPKNKCLTKNAISRLQETCNGV
jgi:hypothetical protein